MLVLSWVLIDFEETNRKFVGLSVCLCVRRIYCPNPQFHCHRHRRFQTNGTDQTTSKYGMYIKIKTHIESNSRYCSH